MAKNPMEMMKLAGRLKIFKEQHPKTIRFFTDVAQNAVREGTVIEMKVTDPDGKDYITNFRVTAEDMETVEMLKNLQEE